MKAADDAVFSGRNIGLTFPHSYAKFLSQEAAALGISRSALVRHALDFYRDHKEEARSLALPIHPARSWGKLRREGRLFPRVPIGAA